MFGISIDDEPDGPVATPAVRRAVAIHWNWTTEYSRDEIATALGVTPRTVSNYLSEGPTEAVREQMDGLEAEVRMVAVAELKDQLQRAGSRSRTADKPVKVWQDENGNLQVRDKTDEMGEVVDRVPVPRDIDLGADEEARFYARAEVRDIIDQLTDITGAAEPEQHEVTGAGGGPVQVEVTNRIVETGGDDGSE